MTGKSERGEIIRRDLETLELPHDASELEIRASYRRLRELYTKGSIATSPIDDEFTPERRREVLDRIDEAYARLSAWLERGREAAQAAASGDAEGLINGAALRRAREVLGLSLHDIERKIKVGVRHLSNIEDEHYGKLPEAVYVQGYVANFARCLGLDAGRASREYMEGFRLWQQKKEK